MSIEELLKDKETSAAWRGQKKRLMQISLGVFLATIVLASTAIYFFYIKKNEQQKQQIDVNSLVQLMKIKEEAKTLHQEINNLSKKASLVNQNKHKMKTKSIGSDHKNKKIFADKKERVEVINYEPGEGFSVVSPKNKNIYIPTGAVFQARLITPIKTSIQKTFVMAETTREFRMDMKRRIPKGSRLIGRSRLNPVLKGVIVEFQTLVLPSGIETSLDGLALSRNALPEIDGLYFSDDLENYGTALAFGFLSGFADASRGREQTIFGSIPDQSLSSKVLSGLGTASFQVAEEILRDIRTKAIEYVVIPAGEPVFVALVSRYDVSQGEKR